MVSRNGLLFRQACNKVNCRADQLFSAGARSNWQGRKKFSKTDREKVDIRFSTRGSLVESVEKLPNDQSLSMLLRRESRILYDVVPC